MGRRVFSAKVECLSEKRAPELLLFVQGSVLYFFKPHSLALVNKIRLSSISKVVLFSGQTTLLSIELTKGPAMLLQSLMASALA